MHDATGEAIVLGARDADYARELETRAFDAACQIAAIARLLARSSTDEAHPVSGSDVQSIADAIAELVETAVCAVGDLGQMLRGQERAPQWWIAPSQVAPQPSEAADASA